MQIVWISVVLACAAILELAAGTYGFMVPALAAAVFYLTIVFGWRAVVIQALLFGALPEFVLGRHFPAVPFLILPGVLALARLWRSEGNTRLLHVQAVPGLACGLFQSAILLPVESFGQERFFWMLLLHNLWLVFHAAIAGAILLPVFCHFFDLISRKLGLSCYLGTATRQEAPHAA